MTEMIKYEDKFEYETAVSELRLTIQKAKAISDAFSSQFIESGDLRKIIDLGIRANPDMYFFLYNALTDELFRALEIAKTLDA